jgi:DNA polymerase-3 subunit delta'
LQQQGVENAATELAHNGGAPLFDHDPVLAKLRSQFIDGLGQPTFASILSLAELVDKQSCPWPFRWAG